MCQHYLPLAIASLRSQGPNIHKYSYIYIFLFLEDTSAISYMFTLRKLDATWKIKVFFQISDSFFRVCFLF